ncbi:hypothetical protein [Psychroserpens sp.]|uniref:phosphoribosyltransferase-like protein n=1 Tax=Psychroserpens sp. TaxID=2020870 RepID=UPI002B27661F|nr:hypothetical protein [Psychroserpens sp.]
MKEFEDDLRRKLKILSDIIWDGKGRKSTLDQWLDNFTEDDFKVNILYLLTHFIYFNKIQVTEMLKSLYRDLYRYPILSKIRIENGNSFDSKIIEPLFNVELSKTRFVGLGGAGESATHLLYPFGHINDIHPDYLINYKEIKDILKEDKKVDNFIFIDDLAGSGTQAKKYLKDLLTELKIEYPNISFTYMVLICTTKALNTLEELGIFKEVKAVYLLDDSFKAFDDKSRFYANENNPSFIDLEATKKYSGEYGKPLYNFIWEVKEGLDTVKANSMADRDKLGFKRGELLLGFHHNTPSNTLPIIWFNEKELPWIPIFPRFNKVYKKPAV